MLNTRGGAEADLTVSRLEPGAANLPLAPQSDGQQTFICIVQWRSLAFIVYSASSWLLAQVIITADHQRALGCQHRVTKAEMFSFVF